MAEQMTPEALTAYLGLAEMVRERFGDNWQIVLYEEDEASVRTEDSTLGHYTELFTTSQVHGDDPLEVAGFLAAAIDNVPLMGAQINRLTAFVTRLRELAYMGGQDGDSVRRYVQQAFAEFDKEAGR